MINWGTTLIQQILNGLTVGSVYALIALGYTMVYGIIELINFAHGEIYMIGAYIGIIFLTLLLPLHLPIILSVSFALIGTVMVTGFYGVTIEKLAYKPLRHAPRLSPLITALGVSIFLQQYIMLLQGRVDKVFPIEVTSHGFTIFGATISFLQTVIIGVALFLMILLQLFVKKTKLGIAMRATAIDKTMASLVGIPVDRIIAVTFLIGSGLAAAGGFLVVMYYGKVNYLSGYIAGLKAFSAAVLGGIGSIPGAMIGGILLGIVESLAAGYISGEWKDAVAFIILIFVLLIKPTGIMGEPSREKV